VPIERATLGEVSRRDLRPDDWHEIWPELADLEEKQHLPSADRSSAAINNAATPAA
jgi:DNA-binding transcriptional regulator YdaS (Cro superfamily)